MARACVLLYLHDAAELRDLRVPPGNRTVTCRRGSGRTRGRENSEQETGQRVGGEIVPVRVLRRGSV